MVQSKAASLMQREREKERAILFIITQDFRATKMGKRPHSNKSALVIGKSMYEQVNYEIFTDQPSGTPNCFGLVCSSDDNPMVVRYFT